MTDRRIAAELTIEELEQALIVKRREARAERMRRQREIGRRPAGGPLPHEDLAAIGPGSGRGRAALRTAHRRACTPDPEPLRGKARRKRPRRSRQGRWRDRVLLGLEIGALLALAAVLLFSLSSLKSLNEEYAVAEPLPAPTLLAGSILPDEHAPPDRPGGAPPSPRDLAQGVAPPAVPIPRPGPEAPTRIVVPAIGVDALVVEGDSWEQLKLGVGHRLNTANPGERGNMVLSAHNDIYGEIFRYLSDLELGDQVIVYAGERPYRYTITAKQIVEPTQVSVLAATARPLATLISCYPYMVDTQRIVIVAELQQGG